MARRKKPEVKCYHCDRDLQYELEAMREALKKEIRKNHSYEKSNRKLEKEVAALGGVQVIEAPDDRYDLKPEEEE